MLMSLVETVEALFGGSGPAKAAEAAAMLSDDVVMIEGGANLRSGVHRGKAAMGTLLKTIQESCDEFRSDMVWVRGDGSQVVSLARARGSRNGRTLDTFVLTLISADANGKIIEIRDLPFDWVAWEEFFASAAPAPPAQAER
jgi:ketosteroid isomerase-like protein